MAGTAATHHVPSVQHCDSVFLPTKHQYITRLTHPVYTSAVQKGVVVMNYANKDQVNGEPVDTSANNSTSAIAGLGSSLGANIPSLVAFPAPFNETTDSSSTAASKLKVGPGIFELPYKIGTKFLFGDYWVVAVGESGVA